MKITIQTLGFTAKDELDNFIHDKVGKLSHFTDQIITGEVCLSTEKSDKKENKICDIRLVIPGNDLLASTHGKTFEEAILQAVEILERQIKKSKTDNYFDKSILQNQL